MYYLEGKNYEHFLYLLKNLCALLQVPTTDGEFLGRHPIKQALAGNF